MGSDKRALSIGGRPMLGRMIDVAAAVADEVLVSCRREFQPDASLYEGRGARLVFDARAEGPIAGMEAGLRASRNPIVLVMPVDMPRISSAMLERLVSVVRERPAIQAVAFEVGGEVMPLPAILRRTALPVIEEQLDRGELRLLDLLSKLGAVLIAAAPEDVAAGAFANLNGPADLSEDWTNRPG
jgi:molybdopterin-guanine dinucleotide biosynthesis protein A